MQFSAIQITALVAVAIFGAVTFPHLLASPQSAVQSDQGSREHASLSQQGIVTAGTQDDPNSSIPLLAPNGQSATLVNPSAVMVTPPTIRSSADTTALKAYGNAVGKAISDHFARQPNQLEVTNQFIQDHTDKERAARVDALATDLERLSREIAAVSEVPTPLQSAHTRLASAYPALAAKLHAIVHAQNETTMFEAMNAYNGTLDDVANALTGISTVYAVTGITFTASEPGNVFNVP